MKQLLITIAAVVLVGCGGNNDIHNRIVKGQYGLVLKYLREGGDINQKCNNPPKATPLHYSLMHGRHKISKLLIDKGADIHAVDIFFLTPLHTAVAPLDSADDPNPNIELIELIIKGGANINSRARGGRTALSKACASGHLDAVNTLIKNGADVSLMNDEGATCLHASAHNGHKQVVELLIQKGADVNVIDKTDRTALDLAMGPRSTLENIKYAIKSEEERRATADLLRKHGGKTGEELKAEGK